MKKSTKVIIGILTFFPVLHLVFDLLAGSISVIIGADSFLNALLATSVFVNSYRWLLITSYLVLALVNKKSGSRIMWFFTIFIGSIYIVPLYWYLYIWKDDMYAVSND
ncbi:hypothetical protein LCGC14_2746470 [marine sediment metagenome]|uniref:Uncharacterized protein n=1 Tax=marine sediment metagenome TaxID=412755 RepID=A0A0F9BBT1_9ZZZZ